MGMKFKGTAIVVRGDHVNLDRAMSWYSGMDALPPEEIIKKFLINADKEIPNKAQKDDIVVGGKDFGCGKAHFSFWLAAKEIGISCIVAEAFSTQMFQGALANKDTYLVEVPGILEAVEIGDEIEVDLELAEVKNFTKNTVIKGQPLPSYILDVMKAGGQMEYIKRKVEERKVK